MLMTLIVTLSCAHLHACTALHFTPAILQLPYTTKQCRDLQKVKETKNNIHNQATQRLKDIISKLSLTTSTN